MGICNLVLPCVRGRFNYSCVADQYVSLKSVDGRQDALGLRVLWVQNPVLTLTSPMAPNSGSSLKNVLGVATWWTLTVRCLAVEQVLFVVGSLTT